MKKWSTIVHKTLQEGVGVCVGCRVCGVKGVRGLGGIRALDVQGMRGLGVVELILLKQILVICKY